MAATYGRRAALAAAVSWLLLAAAALAALAPAAGAAEGLFLSILPPGQNGTLPERDAPAFFAGGELPPHFDDQRPLYAALARAPERIRGRDLLRLFKPAPLEAPRPGESLERPRPGVRIARDGFGVPYVEGRSRADVFFGAGYAAAEDRLFLMDLGRRFGRGRISDLLGPIPEILAMDADIYAFAGYSEAELEAQIDGMEDRLGADGAQVRGDIEAYVDGVNAYVERGDARPELRPAEYALLGLGPVERFRPTDVVAVSITFEQLFGGGGGGEHRNAALLEALRERHGDAAGTALFRDLRSADDAEAPVTTAASFPYLGRGPVDPAAVAMPDPGSLVELPPLELADGAAPSPAGPSGGLARELLGGLLALHRRPPGMSNFLVLTARRSARGHPIAVMGPQTGYFAPEILLEMDLRGPGVRARGAMPPGFPYVIIGHGGDHAWSATAGGSDQVDVRVERLCEPDGSEPSPDSEHYLFRGECRAMEKRIDAWCAGPDEACAGGGGPRVTATVLRTVHGRVFARARVRGLPVALARERSTFRRELDAAVGYMRLDAGAATPEAFRHALEAMPGSFNWAHVDRRRACFFHSGLFPLRAPGVDPDLPSWGTGEWEWRGLLAPEAHPFACDPEEGFLASWNNRPARDWRAADSSFSFGSVHRVDALAARARRALARGLPLGPGEAVAIVAAAAFVDLRGERVLPAALRVLAAAGTPIEASLEALLEAWIEAGAPRRDRDGDGRYEHAAAVALLDAWYPRMVRAVFDPDLSGLFGLVPMAFDDPPGPLGSAYQSGYYGYLEKAFRMALGEPVASPFERLRCGDGSLAGCAAALRESLDAATAELAARFGSADPAAWRADPARDRIEFRPFGVASIPPMPWQNRPTFQQVVQVGAAPPGACDRLPGSGRGPAHRSAGCRLAVRPPGGS